MVPHFTPASGSWMNLVERFFRDLTEEVAPAGGFTSVAELVGAIDDYLAHATKPPSALSGTPKAGTSSPKSTAPAPLSINPNIPYSYLRDTTLGGGGDGAGVDRIGGALGLGLEPLFGAAFLERRQRPGIGRRCPPGTGRHGLAGGRPRPAGCGCQAGDLGLRGSGGLCRCLEKS